MNAASAVGCRGVLNFRRALAGALTLPELLPVPIALTAAVLADGVVAAWSLLFGEGFDDACVVGPERFDEFGEAAVRAAGQHVFGGLAGPEEDRHHEGGDLPSPGCIRRARPTAWTRSAAHVGPAFL
ncbi:hypothetical protein [Streptomyces sp. XY332]|uniref:hypothetical protein n=1 Tax=Streptomyces sp. XY332 TaxID=1415561 RepID=UPI000AF3D8D6